jgi:putative copper export protein
MAGATLVVLARDAGARRAVLREFSAVAAWGLAAVVVTGLLLSGAEVTTVTGSRSWRGDVSVPAGER